jgi:hypothetical protein
VASHSALTEEGRTRIRNFQGRLISYLLLWVVIGFGITLAAIWARTRYGYLPLQRLYLGQYITASTKSLVPHKHPSRYILLVRVIDDRPTGQNQVIGCTDDQVDPVRDEAGKVKFDPKIGPFFRLHNGIPHTYFYWSAVWQPDAEMYSWLRDNIYHGRSLLGLYWICLIPLPAIVIAGMTMSVKFDVRINREYEEGKLLRGIRMLRHTEYAREMKIIDGLGLPVFGPEQRVR